MRGTTTTTTLLRQSRALCELRGLTQNAVRPSNAALRAARGSTQQFARPLRPLHTTPCLLKKKDSGSAKDKQAERRDKGGKSKGKDASASSSSASSSSGDSSSSSQHPTPNPEEPLDFADVQSRLAKASESPLENLKKLKSGGRFNPDQIGAVRVTTSNTSDGTSAVYPLRELAQVVPKGGRIISILAHEAESIKPIMSAIQAHKDFNQQPQRDPDNELELLLKLELDSREDVVRRVKAVCHEWRERVRQVRQRRDKVHAAWKKDGAVLPDVKRKADTELDKVIKAKNAEIDAAEKDALKAAEGK